jgi:predicted ATPase/class 3 adenylate cyclase
VVFLEAADACCWTVSSLSGSVGGVLTFLFTDVVGSTQRWQADRDAMAGALAAHDDVMGQAVLRHGGRVFKHTGDGVCAVFGSPAGAVEAARVAQRDVELPVRIGIHSGEAQEREGDFFGPTLNRCARLMDAGHGGQILLSEVTHALLPGIEVVDLGEYRLKDLPTSERIYQLGTARHPPLRAKASVSTLPPSLTDLIGRDELVAEVGRRLECERLVTLVGVGGVGKTRVAVAAAETLAPRQDLTVFVDLGSVSDGADVGAAVARSLELTTPSPDALGLALGGRTVLLVLDNCEHVLDDVVALIEGAFRASTSVRVLATSREALGVAGEWLVAVPGLGSDGAASPAVSLFVARAAAAAPGFGLEDLDVQVVEELCRRLDGIPLAIELAAARVTTMTPVELVGRLDERFRVLTGGRRRRARDRHRTLRETIDWSYRLLEPDEQQALRLLSVFPSSFSLAGATAVLGDTDEFAVLDILGALVDKSLLGHVEEDGLARYRFLETIRSYGTNRLDEAGEHDSAATRMGQHLVETVTRVVNDMFTASGDVAARLHVEIPNLRRALDDALGAEDLASATSLLAPLARIIHFTVWYTNGWAGEIVALARRQGVEPDLALRLLQASDAMLDHQFLALRSLLSDILARLHDHAESWWIYERLAVLNLAVADFATARHLLARHDAALSTQPVTADDRLFAQLEHRADEFRMRDWNTDSAVDDKLATLVEQGRAHRSRLVRGAAADVRAYAARAAGDPVECLTSSRESARCQYEGSAYWFSAVQLQASAYLKLDQLAHAVEVADMNIEHARRWGDRSALIMPIAAYATALHHVGEPEAAATLRGWLPHKLSTLFVDEIGALDDWLASALDPPRLDELTQRGGAMSPAELQQLARHVIGTHTSLGTPTHASSP